jgi:hypothetical protein
MWACARAARWGVCRSRPCCRGRPVCHTVHNRITRAVRSFQSPLSPPAVVAVQSNKVYLAQEAFMVCFSITARKINAIR